MSQCYECAFYKHFYRACKCPTKNAAYNRPLDVSVNAWGEAPACEFFKDSDEVM